jgi:hypothetical protein
MAQLVKKIGDEVSTYRTDDPLEIARMKARGYAEGQSAGDVPPTLEDLRFHPVGKKVSEVMQYLAENPGDAERVIAEEKAGEARPTIVGVDAPAAPAAPA